MISCGCDRYEQVSSLILCLTSCIERDADDENTLPKEQETVALYTFVPLRRKIELVTRLLRATWLSGRSQNAMNNHDVNILGRQSPRSSKSSCMSNTRVTSLFLLQTAGQKLYAITNWDSGKRKHSKCDEIQLGMPWCLLRIARVAGDCLYDLLAATCQRHRDPCRQEKTRKS